MINNATIDIRNDDGSANGAPMDEYIVSVPLSQCVVTWDENTGSTYVGSTIGNAITSNPEEGMLSNVIIQVPVDYNLEPGNYWTVFKSNTVHVLRNQTENSDLFRIDVFAHNNNSDDSFLPVAQQRRFYWRRWLQSFPRAFVRYIPNVRKEKFGLHRPC